MIKEMFKRKEQQPAENNEPKLREENLRKEIEQAREEQLSVAEEQTATEQAATEQTATESKAGAGPKAEQAEESNAQETASEESASEEDQAEEGKTEESADKAQPESGKPQISALEEAYCLGAGIDSETLVKAKAILTEISTAANAEKFNPTALQLALRLLRYEETVEEAHRRGLEKGRAERMAEIFRDKRARAEEAAAIPHLGGTPGATGARDDNSIFALARGAK